MDTYSALVEFALNRFLDAFDEARAGLLTGPRGHIIVRKYQIKATTEARVRAVTTGLHVTKPQVLRAALALLRQERRRSEQAGRDVGYDPTHTDR